ncbi:hypothetical protein D9615_006702 [Tricholomella constricta]|uniref:Uncharacterized protein n=1 Tax=Tricholomella constricta TaxID=117010 RepID=A0A8H5M286_9AGAR|nr:hypothetical protein D9615_006702 [Tricholomella constricta]
MVLVATLSSHVHRYTRSMYIPILNSPYGTTVEILIDVILEWFKKLYARLEHLFAEKYPVVLQWFGKVFAQLGHFLAIAWDKTSEWLLFVPYAANELFKAHPYIVLSISWLIFLGPWILVIPLFLLQAFFFIVLHALGFGLSGITGGSPAALYQSFCFGGHTPANSLFAMLQSMGTHYNVGTVSHWVLAVIRIVSGAIGLYVLLAIILT